MSIETERKNYLLSNWFISATISLLKIINPEKSWARAAKLSSELFVLFNCLSRIFELVIKASILYSGEGFDRTINSADLEE